jgi:hypothetical protein
MDYKGLKELLEGKKFNRPVWAKADSVTGSMEYIAAVCT